MENILSYFILSDEMLFARITHHYKSLYSISFKTYPNPEFSGTYSDHPKSGGRAMAPANDQMMPRRIHAQSGPLTLANAGLKT